MMFNIFLIIEHIVSSSSEIHEIQTVNCPHERAGKHDYHIKGMIVYIVVLFMPRHLEKHHPNENEVASLPAVCKNKTSDNQKIIRYHKKFG